MDEFLERLRSELVGRTIVGVGDAEYIGNNGGVVQSGVVLLLDDGTKEVFLIDYDEVEFLAFKKD